MSPYLTHPPSYHSSKWSSRCGDTYLEFLHRTAPCGIVPTVLFCNILALQFLFGFLVCRQNCDLYCGFPIPYPCEDTFVVVPRLSTCPFIHILIQLVIFNLFCSMRGSGTLSGPQNFVWYSIGFDILEDPQTSLRKLATLSAKGFHSIHHPNVFSVQQRGGGAVGSRNVYGDTVSGVQNWTDICFLFLQCFQSFSKHLATFKNISRSYWNNIFLPMKS